MPNDADTADSRTVEVRKRELRRELLARRASVSASRARTVGDRIVEHLVASRRYAGARVVALYAARGGEPDLGRLFDLGRRARKTMLLPRCGDDRRLQFHEVREWSELAPGRIGLLEPPASAPTVASSEIDLMVVPCVAVDARGRRLGQGGGWYDRSFPSGGVGETCRVAAVHAFQCVAQVPVAAHDRAVNGIASEAGICWLVG